MGSPEGTEAPLDDAIARTPLTGFRDARRWLPGAIVAAMPSPRKCEAMAQMRGSSACTLGDEEAAGNEAAVVVTRIMAVAIE
jgi:hypothetical protein